jgi:hypothetical protein
MAWLIYQAVATQFAHDFKVDVFRVMDHFGVVNHYRILQKLSTIYECARQNEGRTKG